MELDDKQRKLIFENYSGSLVDDLPSTLRQMGNSAEADEFVDAFSRIRNTDRLLAETLWRQLIFNTKTLQTLAGIISDKKDEAAWHLVDTLKSADAQSKVVIQTILQIVVFQAKEAEHEQG